MSIWVSIPKSRVKGQVRNIQFHSMGGFETAIQVHAHLLPPVNGYKTSKCMRTNGYE